MNNRLSLFFALVFLASATTAQVQQGHFQATGHSRVTDSESLWMGRFSDCDLRYYLLIPSGFIGHGTRPPGPIHGLLFGLPDTKTSDVVTAGDERFILVRANVNSRDLRSVEQFADHVTDDLAKERPGFDTKLRQSSPLNGQPAIKLRFEYDGPNGRVTQEEILSLRSGILYELRLRTTAAHYGDDSAQFAKIVEGFRFWTNYYCYGTNNNP